MSNRRSFGRNVEKRGVRMVKKKKKKQAYRTVQSFFSPRQLVVHQVDVIEIRIDRRCSALQPMLGDAISGISRRAFYLPAITNILLK